MCRFNDEEEDKATSSCVCVCVCLFRVHMVERRMNVSKMSLKNISGGI